MALDLLKKSRWFTIASMLALASVSTVGCAADTLRGGSDGRRRRGRPSTTSPRSRHSKVKRQSIGNCWLYATTSWLEALNKAATGVEKNTSESWLTYWHWYEQLANGSARTEISTGGSYGTGADLINRYGIMIEGDFIAGEAEAEMSAASRARSTRSTRASRAAPLKDAVAAATRRRIREELDAPGASTPRMITRLNNVFGEGVTRTLDRSSYASSRAASNKIIRAKDFPVQLKDPRPARRSTPRSRTRSARAPAGGGRARASSRGTRSTTRRARPSAARSGSACRRRSTTGSPSSPRGRSTSTRSTRRACSRSTSSTRRGPGRQGGHMTVMHDYQAEVPGPRAPQGRRAGDARADARRRSPTARRSCFVRVKNSWGGIRPDRWNDAAIPGYHDLEMKYLEGPIKECSEGADGHTDTTNCTRSVTPLWDVVLPAGY